MNPAGFAEVWAARAWNVFNEGKPFSIVYPAMVLAAAAPLGLGPDGGVGLALAGALALAAVLSRFSFPLRGRALLWVAAAASVPLLEPWRAPELLLGALAGYAFFTVLFWGTLYYRLRTGAPGATSLVSGGWCSPTPIPRAAMRWSRSPSWSWRSVRERCWRRSPDSGASRGSLPRP